MKTRAAVLWEDAKEWQVEEVELDGPREGEVLVRTAYAGLCHSDEHLLTRDLVPPPEVTESLGLPPLLPIIGGHEGAGVVLEVGPGVSRVRPGDHVACSFIPACGACRYCVTGRSFLCDIGAQLLVPGMTTDGTVRHHCDDHGLNVTAKCGTFAEHMLLAEASVVKVDPDLPLAAAALVSCGVATGYGSAVNRAGTTPGDTVVVVGVGGIGINAVQGARIAGGSQIVAVDPVEFKRHAAVEFGATHTTGSIEEAIPLVQELTAGRMAERVIVTPGVLHGDLLAGVLALTGKGGTCVLTAAAPLLQEDAKVNLFELVMWNKEIKGCLYGVCNPQVDVPGLLELYRSGQLKLDELVTKTYSLDQINEGFDDLRNGRIIRGLLSF